jgi:hypothetical protein
MAPLDRGISPLPLWAKLERTDADTGVGWHSLADHSADVAACIEALLRLGTVQRRLAGNENARCCAGSWRTTILDHALAPPSAGF